MTREIPVPGRIYVESLIRTARSDACGSDLRIGGSTGPFGTGPPRAPAYAARVANLSAAIHPALTAADELTFDELAAEIERLWQPRVAAHPAEAVSPRIAPPFVAVPAAPSDPVEDAPGPLQAAEPRPLEAGDLRQVPPDLDPVLLPLCRTDVRIILGDTVASARC